MVKDDWDGSSLHIEKLAREAEREKEREEDREGKKKRKKGGRGREKVGGGPGRKVPLFHSK